MCAQQVSIVLPDDSCSNWDYCGCINHTSRLQLHERKLHFMDHISFPYNNQSSCHCYRYSIDWQCHLLCFYWLTYTSKPSYSLAQSLLLSWTTLWRSDICCSNCGCVLTIFAFCSGATTVYGILTFHSVNSALTSWFASLIDVDVTVVYKRPWGSGK